MISWRMGLCSWKVRFVKHCGCKLTEELLSMCPGYSVHETLSVFWHPLVILSGSCFLLCVPLCFYCVFCMLKFCPLWSTELFSIKVMWSVWFLFDRMIEIQILPGRSGVREALLCFQQLMMCLETYIIFLFYSFSFLTGDSKALMNWVVYSEEISVKFYFLFALCELAGDCLYILSSGTT